MRLSFRLRLALLSALLTGITLGGFGVAAWWQIRDLKVERVDVMLRSMAEREAARRRPDADWPAVESDLATHVGAPDPGDLALFVQGDGGEVIYRSASWPVVWTADQLPWPGAVVAPVAPVSMMRPVTSPFALLALLIPAARAAPGDDLRPGPPGGRPPDGADRPPPPWGPPPPRDRADRPPPRDGYGSPDQSPATQRSPAPAPPARQVVPLPAVPATVVVPDGPAAADVSSGAGSTTTGAAGATVTNDPDTSLTRPPVGPPPQTAVIALSAGPQTWRVALAVTRPARIAVAYNLRAVDREMAGIRNAFLLALAPALLLIAAGAWWLSGRAMRPVEQITSGMRRVNAEGLDQRLALVAADQEFAQLADVFNAMLERLETSFRQAARFSADAAHELRTPLAILQGQIERSIADADTGSPLQIRLVGILDEVRRLAMITEKLLMLSLADSGRLPLERVSLNLSALLEELLDDARLLAPTLNVTGDIPTGLVVSADANLVVQILHNLLANAIKYNIPGGWVHISATQALREVYVSVSNMSRGVSPADEARVFERFYRADKARAREVDGFGLGLSLSREIALAHGGDLSFQAGADHRVFVVLMLPRTDPTRPVRDTPVVSEPAPSSTLNQQSSPFPDQAGTFKEIDHV